MCENCNDNNCNCISEVLNVICILQNEACPGNTCLPTCTRSFLGTTATAEFNTRPVTLYTSNNTLIEMPVSNDPTETTTSSIFRVEKVDGCCCTLRVLVYDPTTASYTSTSSFFTINTKCCCSIKCLADTFVEGV